MSDDFRESCLESFLRELTYRERSVATLRDYQSFIRHFFDWLDSKGILLESVDKQIIKDYISAQTSTAVTCNSRLRHLKSFFKWLQAESYIETNPTDGIGFKKVASKIKDILKPDEVSRMIAYMQNKKTFQYKRDAMLMLLLFDTGLRISEALGIKLTEININSNSIIVTGKGNKMRVVYFGDKTRKALIKYGQLRTKHYPKTVYLFPSTNPTGCLTPNPVTKRFRDIGLKLFKKRVYAHLLRHSWATLNAINGMPGPLLQQALGHTSFDMTRKYLSIVDSKKLGEYYKSNSIVDKELKSSRE